jgi:putative OPT family oligopeptide transporter
MGALVIPPILNLLDHAYGFNGPHALPAPQATLISALAKGVIQGQIDWGMIGMGALVGCATVALDEILRITGRMRLPPLAVGLGIYLPAATITPIVLGAIVGRIYNDRIGRGAHAEAGKRLGVLLASGLIVGESLFGVLLAGLIVATHNEEPLALVGDAFTGPANIIGTIAFAAAIVGLYRWIGTLARR